jgi:hypothetical protein
MFNFKKLKNAEKEVERLDNLLKEARGLIRRAALALIPDKRSLCSYPTDYERELQYFVKDTEDKKAEEARKAKLVLDVQAALDEIERKKVNDAVNRIISEPAKRIGNRTWFNYGNFSERTPDPEPEGTVGRTTPTEPIGPCEYVSVTEAIAHTKRTNFVAKVTAVKEAGRWLTKKQAIEIFDEVSK